MGPASYRRCKLNSSIPIVLSPYNPWDREFWTPSIWLQEPWIYAWVHTSQWARLPDTTSYEPIRLSTTTCMNLNLPFFRGLEQKKSTSWGQLRRSSQRTRMSKSTTRYDERRCGHHRSYCTILRSVQQYRTNARKISLSKYSPKQLQLSATRKGNGLPSHNQRLSGYQTTSVDWKEAEKQIKDVWRAINLSMDVIANTPPDFLWLATVNFLYVKVYYPYDPKIPDTNKNGASTPCVRPSELQTKTNGAKGVKNSPKEMITWASQDETLWKRGRSNGFGCGCQSLPLK